MTSKIGHNYCSKRKGKFGISVTESQLIEYVEYLIDNIFTRIKKNIKKCNEM